MATPETPYGSDGGVSQARQLRRELSRCREDLSDAKRALEEERAHAKGLERLLEDAYDRLEGAGLTDRLDFPVSREAIRLFDALEPPASFDEIIRAAEEVGCGSEEAAALLAELVEEGVLARSGASSKGCYVATGHRPFF